MDKFGVILATMVVETDYFFYKPLELMLPAEASSLGLKWPVYTAPGGSFEDRVFRERTGRPAVYLVGEQTAMPLLLDTRLPGLSSYMVRKNLPAFEVDQTIAQDITSGWVGIVDPDLENIHYINADKMAISSSVRLDSVRAFCGYHPDFPNDFDQLIKPVPIQRGWVIEHNSILTPVCSLRRHPEYQPIYELWINQAGSPIIKGL